MWRMGGQPTTWILMPSIQFGTQGNTRRHVKRISILIATRFEQPGGFWSCDGWAGGYLDSVATDLLTIERLQSWTQEKTHDDKHTQWNNHSPPWRFLIIWWLVDRTSQQTFLNNNACCHKHNRGCHISYWKYNSTELSMRNKCNFTTQASSFQPP